MKRLNFTFDDDTSDLLDEIADRYYHGNKSLTVRAALESLATHLGHAGWVIAGYVPAVLDHSVSCHSCGRDYPEGDVLYRPTFSRGHAPNALTHIPQEPWLDCSTCVESRSPATPPLLSQAASSTITSDRSPATPPLLSQAAASTITSDRSSS